MKRPLGLLMAVCLLAAPVPAGAALRLQGSSDPLREAFLKDQERPPAGSDSSLSALIREIRSGFAADQQSLSRKIDDAARGLGVSPGPELDEARARYLSRLKGRAASPPAFATTAGTPGAEARMKPGLDALKREFSPNPAADAPALGDGKGSPPAYGFAKPEPTRSLREHAAINKLQAAQKSEHGLEGAQKAGLELTASVQQTLASFADLGRAIPEKGPGVARRLAGRDALQIIVRTWFDPMTQARALHTMTMDVVEAFTDAGAQWGEFLTDRMTTYQGLSALGATTTAIANVWGPKAKRLAAIGDNVSIPRGHGGFTNGKIERFTEEGKAVVRFDDPELGPSRKPFDPTKLEEPMPIPDLRVNTEVAITAKDGTLTPALVTRIEGDSVIVRYDEGEHLMRKRVAIADLKPRSAIPTFEIGDAASPHGHSIAGGVSRGRAGGREILRVDWRRDKALDDFYEQVLKDSNLREFRAKGLELNPKMRSFLIGDVFNALKARVIGGAEGVAWAENLAEKYKDIEVLIGDAALIPGKGVCRHFGLLNAAILERLIQEGYLHGKIYYVRGKGHGWAVYESSHGPDRRMVIDVMQQDRPINMNPGAQYWNGTSHVPYGADFPL